MTNVRCKLADIFKSINKKMNKPTWHNLRNVKPVSKVFGFDRGLPIDRYYIEGFLNENKNLIRDVVLEIAEDTYSKKFASDVKRYEIFDYVKNPSATMQGDLTNMETLLPNRIDCFICTQTLNFIYDFHSAISGIYYMLKENGVALVTVAGISQISQFDVKRWGDYWRFTDASMKKSFAEVFGKDNVQVDFYGNVLSSIAFLEGISSEELTKKELNYKDKNYQIIITIIAKKTVL